MPYGNKDLHFGHIGGVFIHADAFARFLKDRIGAKNVIFVSGTDCYGSPIVADYTERKQHGEAVGSLEDFVSIHHQKQMETLRGYAVEPSLFAASALEPYRSIHENLGAYVMNTLYRNGHLQKRSSVQFYDATRQAYLNGRQVLGRCPIEGCRSEKGYADECSLGHQYEPKDLISPVSTLTGTVPEMREVTNWYVPLESFREALLPWANQLAQTKGWRDFAFRAVLEYFEPPTIYVKREHLEDSEEVIKTLPAHRREAGRGESDKLVFESLEAQDNAKTILAARGIRYRSGKTLVPFRLTGNLEWGLSVPPIEGQTGMTFWVWPESLWAPISFTKAFLAKNGAAEDDWKRWWSSKDATVYQFIGEDNLFFYGVAEMAMFLGLQGKEMQTDPPEGELQLPLIVANRHLLFLDKKASSSGTVKPPSARALLEFYSGDQLRLHFLSLALGLRNASFRPKPFDPAAAPSAADPVLREGNLVTNALNQSVRSCFYTAQKYYDRMLPPGEVSPEVIDRAEEAIVAFENAMAALELHTAVEGLSHYIREINSLWSRHNPYRADCDPEVRRRTLVDAFHMVRVATVLVHPLAPVGAEKVREYLGVGTEFWSWDHIFAPLQFFFPNPGTHRFVELPPKVDFFEKPACQVQRSHD
jgi:methionyl-tRNA synthetase